MHDKHNPKEGSTPPKHQRTKILVFIANWVADTRQHWGDTDEVIDHIATLKRVYLMSDWANDQDERREILDLFDQIEGFVNGFSSFTAEDFVDFDEWLKLSA